MDWNNDGKKDLMLGEGAPPGKIRIFLNNGTDENPTFDTFFYLQLAGSDFSCPQSTATHQIIPTVVDWNNDGLFDLLIGCYPGHFHLLLNTGTVGNPVFETEQRLTTQGGEFLNAVQKTSPAVVDFDGDGKKDLISGSFMGHIFLYTNVGTDAEPAFDNASGVMLNAGGVLLDIGIGNYLRPTVADWDGDGILDVLYGEVAGTVTLLRGEGPSD